MAKNTKGSPIKGIVNLAVWITGVLVSLAVGFGMTAGGALNQSIPYLSSVSGGIIISIAGWIVVILTLISVILAIVNNL